MRYSITSTAALAATALAGDVNIVWSLDSTSGASSVAVYDAQEGSVLAQGCGSVLPGSDASQIDFSGLDGHGSGNFTVGDAEYHVHYNTERSGGPSCSTVYSDRVALVECSGVSWDGSDASSEDVDCFEDKAVSGELRSLRVSNAANAGSARRTKRQPRQHMNKERQLQTRETQLVGDGDPHDTFWHAQRTLPHDCQGGSCTATFGTDESFSVGFSADVSPFEWISGGFSVSKSYTQSESYLCNAEAGQTVCVWHVAPHTAYTVKNVRRVGFYVTDESDPFIMRSPKSADKGHFYCVRGHCRNRGDGYWADE